MKQMILLSGLLFLFFSSEVVSREEIKYPDNYRYWTHVKSLTLHAGHPLENPFKGIHHIYANKEGVAGMKNGKFDDGAVIVFDLLESVNQDNASSEGKRILVGVMTKNNNRYSATGGWGFEAWSGNSKSKRLTNDGGASCFACHTSKKENDFVFSQWRD